MHSWQDHSKIPLLGFVTMLRESLKVADLAANYMAGIPGLVNANAYGFYILDPANGGMTRVAVRGGVDRFIDRYEEVGYTCDPLLQHIIHTRESVHDGTLFSDKQWQRHPLREALEMRCMVRLLEAPLVANAKTVGMLSLSRNPRNPRFTKSDLGTLQLIAHHVGAAMGHALEHLAAEARQHMAEGALNLLDTAIILSDERGNVKFANKSARILIDQAESVNRGAGLFSFLRKNLDTLASGCSEAAVDAAAVISNNGTAIRGENIELRSVPIFDPGYGVATFLHRQNAGRRLDFRHLRRVLRQREIEVLELLAQGLQNKEIAERLFISTNTVKYHLKRMYQAMGVSSRSELLSRAYASQRGDLPAGAPLARRSRRHAHPGACA